MKKDKRQDLFTWLRPRLRRLSYTWPERNEAKKLARVSRGNYQCAICKKIFKSEETSMDHTNPVVPVTGIDRTKSLEEIIGSYVVSLFVYREKWQCICNPCHDKKTAQENEERAKNKALDSK